MTVVTTGSDTLERGLLILADAVVVDAAGKGHNRLKDRSTSRKQTNQDDDGNADGDSRGGQWRVALLS